MLNKPQQTTQKKTSLAFYILRCQKPLSHTHTRSTHNLRAIRLSQNPISLSLSTTSDLSQWPLLQELRFPWPPSRPAW